MEMQKYRTQVSYVRVFLHPNYKIALEKKQEGADDYSVVITVTSVQYNPYWVRMHIDQVSVVMAKKKFIHEKHYLIS